MVLHRINSQRHLFLLNSGVQLSNFSLIQMNTSYNGKLQSVFLVKIMYNDNNHFCRGDTISRHLSVSNLYFKLDFRIIVKDFDNNEFDITTGELARHSSTTQSKMYRDFLKSALTTKVHLNTILKRMPYIPEKQDPKRCYPNGSNNGVILCCIRNEYNRQKGIYFTEVVFV